MVDFKKALDQFRSKKQTQLSEPLKNAQTAIIQQPVSTELYEMEVLRRSLPFVVKIDIETDETTTKAASVIVHYKNGLIAKIECYRKPEKTEELINVALAGTHQCLSDLAYGALFSFAGKDRRVWREAVQTIDDMVPIIISTELSSDAPKFTNAVPDGAPGLRDILLSLPGVACMPGENSTSNSQVKGRQGIKISSMDDPRVAMMERGRIRHDRVEKPKLDKTTATRATTAMAELLRSVGIDGSEEKTDEKR
ncbi:MAG: hypothetical protein WC565_02050 [Parcubacteria group bacterium]